MSSWTDHEGPASAASGQAWQGVHGDGQTCNSRASTAAEMQSDSGTSSGEGPTPSASACPARASSAGGAGGGGGTHGAACHHQRATFMALRCARRESQRPRACMRRGRLRPQILEHIRRRMTSIRRALDGMTRHFSLLKAVRDLALPPPGIASTCFYRVWSKAHLPQAVERLGAQAQLGDSLKQLQVNYHSEQRLDEEWTRAERGKTRGKGNGREGDLSRYVDGDVDTASPRRLGTSL